MLLVKGQVHYAHNGLNIVQAISFHRKHGLEYFTKLLHRIQGSIATLIKGQGHYIQNGKDIAKYFVWAISPNPL
jgi:hypothetical protein